MYYLGIDLGTSSVKLLLLDSDNNVVKTVSRQYPIYYPENGWSEQDPKDWLREVKTGIQEITRILEEKSETIEAIGIDGQMHGLVVLDENDVIIRNAILWNDGRAVEEVAYLNNKIGKETLLDYTGNIAFAGFTAPKILWMKNHEPEFFQRIKKIMLPKDYIIYMLTGQFVSDYSDAAGTLLLDVKNRKWSEGMMKLCGITENMLPELYESYERVGVVKKDIAEELGLCERCIMVAGASDNGAAAIGTGVVGENACMVSLGTSGTILASGNYVAIEEPYGIHSFAHPDGSYHVLGCILSAASCVNWWNTKVLETDDFGGDSKDEFIFRKDLYFLPYLMGERSPHNDPFARGAFIGLDMDTSRSAMRVAILEGVAFAIRDSLEIIRKSGAEITQIRLSGGGAKNKLWQRILASIFDAELLLMESEEGAALGSAILASVGAGRFDTVKEAVESIIKAQAKVEPEKDLVDIYNKKYEIFRSIYPRLKDVFKNLHR